MAVMARVRTRWFPLYSTVKHLLTALTGVPKGDVATLLREVWDRAGTYTARVDWSEPSAWIPEMLSGASATLAWRIWETSGHRVNPRHIYGAYLLISHYDLAKTDLNGFFRLTEGGAGFLEDQLPALVPVDEAEGVAFLLNLVVIRGRSKRGDLILEWSEFLGKNSDWKGPEMVRDSLRRRLANLVDRGLLNRLAGTYVATDTGLEYLSKVTSRASDPMAQVLHAAMEYNTIQREALTERLTVMSPRGFEFLVAQLLEAMGYRDVEVTSESHDKGVDVKATADIGTTPIRHVYQVKHWRHNVGRKVVTELRGSLVEHDATIGTIVTLGKFTKGAIAASLADRTTPIGLIDGEKLVVLLTNYELGIRRRSVDLHELDAAALEELSKEPLDDTPSEE